jgi:glycerophosphoryl diester phosphodiesterase
MALRLARVYGHRGAAATAPENTLAGVRRAAAVGAGAVEFDVKLTADGVPFCLHDDTFDRTTDGKGDAGRLTLAEIQRLDAGSWFGPAFAGEPVPTLDAILDLILELGLDANVEIKPVKGREAETGAVVADAVARRWPGGRQPPILSSFRPASLEAAKSAQPDLPRGYLVERPGPGWQADVERLGCATLHVGHKKLDRALMGELTAMGKPVLLWTINDVARAREVMSWGATSVITDVPELMADL